MSLTVTNTLSGEREQFEPQDPESVLLYYCGLTVSDDAHLGHARSWVHVDVMHRWLSHLGYDVRHVENFTDVNEKIVARIGPEGPGDTEEEVAAHYITSVIEDMRGLNLLRAEVYPRVSEHVPEIIDLIETLIERDYAYESNGSVYFDVSRFEGYGSLSNQSLDEMEAQGQESEIEEKRRPEDFALWKAGPVDAHAIAEHRDESPDALPISTGGQTWDSPWGEGRPGWHIECSAMSMNHLDDTIDLHVGGQDLVFPHHENEIAQSEAATGQEFVRYWLHVSLLETEGEKMSTSLENFFTVSNALEEFGVNPIRMFLLSSSYRRPQTYSQRTLDEAVERWERLERAYRRTVEAADSPDAYTKVESGTLRQAIVAARESFTEAMNDDFNTREAIAALLELATAVNAHLDDVNEYDYRGLRRVIETFEELGGEVLGFLFGERESHGEVSLAAELVDLILEVREAEREAGNYERADRLRDDLEALGIEVQDTDTGPEFRLP
ncbi:MAG: cysteine--tRNA ligase [Halodesulfurarchaeum sp.]